MSKDPMGCITNYQKYLHMAIEELMKLFSDKEIQEQVSQELQARAARLYVCLIDLGKVASLKDSEHLKKFTLMVDNFLEQIPLIEKTEVEFAGILSKIEDKKKNIILKGGNC